MRDSDIEFEGGADEELSALLASSEQLDDNHFHAFARVERDRESELEFGDGAYRSSYGMQGEARVYFDNGGGPKKSLIATLEFISFPGRRFPPIGEDTWDCISDDGESVRDAMWEVNKNTKLRARCDSQNGTGIQRFWVKWFKVAHRWQGKGLGYIALHHALMAIGAQGQEIYAFPQRIPEDPEEERWLRDFWIHMDERAIYLADHNVVFVPAYNLSHDVHFWHDSRPKANQRGGDQ